MPYYFFQQDETVMPPRYELVDECRENAHQEAAEKEHAYNDATIERGEPVVRRVYAKSLVEAKAIIEEYGPNLTPLANNQPAVLERRNQLT